MACDTKNPEQAYPAIKNLTKRTEFLAVAKGCVDRRKTIVIQALKPRKTQKSLPSIRVGFTATKRVGNAVIRNRSKRRLREIARQLLPHNGITGADYVFIARQDTYSANWNDLLQDAEKALKRLKRLLNNPPDT